MHEHTITSKDKVTIAFRKCSPASQLCRNPWKKSAGGKETPGWCRLLGILKGFQYSPSWWGLLRKCDSPELRGKFPV